MKNLLRIGFLFLILIMGNSCKSYKNLDKVKPKTETTSMEEKLQKLELGDKIKVYDKNGSVWVLTYLQTDSGMLKGLRDTKSREELFIRTDEIVQVQVKKSDAKKTVLATGTVLVVSSLAFILGLFIYMGTQSS